MSSLPGKYDELYIYLRILLMFSTQENTSTLQPTLPSDDNIGEPESNVQNNAGAVDVDNINKSIVESGILVTSLAPIAETDSTPVLSPAPVQTLPGAQENEVERQRVTTTDIQLNTERHISKWNSDEVQEWFQSYQLNELYKFLFTPRDTKDGAALAKIFESKLKNYEQYRNGYRNRLPSGSNNLAKDFDRFGQLLDTYFINKYEHRFDVAFSFPGEIRGKVNEIARKLCEKINKKDGRKRIFYDEYHQAELARPNLDLYLHTIYRYQTRLIVVFMCADYSLKEWCGLEARAIRSLMKTYQNDRIMLLTVDGTTIDGVLDIDGYMDISGKTEDDVVAAIYSRLEALGNTLPLSKSSHTPPPQRPPGFYLNELKPVPKLLFLSNYQLYIDATQLDQYRFQGIVDIDAHTAANLLLFCVAYFGIKYPLHKLAMNAIVDFNSVK
ncbi:unnamed protein product [Rotaria socialis]|uniref:SAM domain-containing protein n=1 Tax=Rotaria socialis TaxID=392032 RepID=A0A820YQN7_9BILA|nr:unnamed protein product [Rotaria socialis]